MTAAAAIRQADISRLMRAAKRENVAVEIDLMRGTARIIPLDAPPVPPQVSWLAADGEEDFGAE